MSGAFRAERIEAPRRRPGSRSSIAHDHVVFELSSGVVVTFNDPRRFGVDGSDSRRPISEHEALRAIGPEPLGDAFDAAVLARACAGKRVALKVVLLDQRLVAGVGNIYASEALHHAGLSPRRRASTIATPAGAPREAAFRLAAANQGRAVKAVDAKGARVRVRPFPRLRARGQAVPQARLPGTIRRITQAGRSTYYCPVCQR